METPPLHYSLVTWDKLTKSSLCIEKITPEEYLLYCSIVFLYFHLDNFFWGFGNHRASFSLLKFICCFLSNNEKHAIHFDPLLPSFQDAWTVRLSFSDFGDPEVLSLYQKGTIHMNNYSLLQLSFFHRNWFFT